MARVTVEDCLEHVTDQFALVHLAASRYRQLHRGASRLVENKNKDIVCALREIASQKVRFREDVAQAVLQERRKPAAPGAEADAGVVLTSPVDEAENPTPLI